MKVRVFLLAGFLGALTLVLLPAAVFYPGGGGGVGDVTQAGQNNFTGSNSMTGALNADLIQAKTNLWAGPTNNIDCSQGNSLYFVAITNMQINGLVNKPVGVDFGCLLQVSNSIANDLTMYLPQGFICDDSQLAYVVTNKTMRNFWIYWSGNNNTQCVSRPFPGSPLLAGTVTSVAASGPAGFTWSGAVTASGTLTATTPGTLHTNGMSILSTFSNNVSVLGGFLAVSNQAGGSMVTMTNGTLQVSNNASVPGQVISSSNTFQVDTPQFKKSLQVDTNGTVYVNGGLGFTLSSASEILTNIVVTNVTLNFPSTTAQNFSDLLINVANLKSNDIATINAPAISQTNGIFSAWISNTFLFARYHNYAATAIDPAQGIFNVMVLQYK